MSKHNSHSAFCSKFSYRGIAAFIVDKQNVLCLKTSEPLNLLISSAPPDARFCRHHGAAVRNLLLT